MDAALQVHLAEPFDAEPLGGVDEVADLHRIPSEEGDRLEQRATAGVLSGQRLDHPRQRGVEQVDERSGDELCDPATTTLLEDPLNDDRALVIALDVLQARLKEERPQRPVDHPVVPVLHVRVGPYDDVATRLEDRLPERFALADERAVAR